jgi:hypothetical protein
VDPSSLLGPLDLSSLLPHAGADLASMPGPDLATSLSSLLPNAGADLASMLGTELGVNLASLIPQLLMSLIP